MVVMAIFLIAISSVLTFYVHSRRAYTLSEEASQFERNSSRLMDYLERELPPARVLAGERNFVIYRRPKKGDLGGPLETMRFPEFEPENTTLSYEDDYIIQRTGTRQTRLFSLGLDGTVIFSLSPTRKEITVVIQGKPKNASISRKRISVRNTLVLINSTFPR
jgi:hypothetical protein